MSHTISQLNQTMENHQILTMTMMVLEVAPATTLTIVLGADSVAQISGPRRRMVHATMAEWYDMYKGRAKCDEPASTRTFIRV